MYFFCSLSVCEILFLFGQDEANQNEHGKSETVANLYVHKAIEGFAAHDALCQIINR